MHSLERESRSKILPRLAGPLACQDHSSFDQASVHIVVSAGLLASYVTFFLGYIVLSIDMRELPRIFPHC